MRPKVRRFGPVLLWQFGTLLLWLAAIASAAPFRRSFDGPLGESLGALPALLLLIAVPAILQEAIRGLLAR